MSRPTVTVVGGGAMGAATACFLARDHRDAHGGPRFDVVVLERDTTYARASSSLSASSIRQQFSQAVNIALSQWSLAFLRRVADELTVGPSEAERPAIGLVEPGYLYLAGDAAGADALRDSHAVQRACGADVALLSPSQLRERFAWLHVDDLVLGSLGLAGEGWFDGPALAQAFRRKAVACGARFVAAEARDFECDGDRVRAVVGADGRRHATDALVLAAGAWSAPLAAKLGFALPVSPKKRDVFVVESPARLPGCPLLIDPSGVWLRPEGRGYLCGAPPREPEPGDPDEPPLDAIDHALFDEAIWPALAARIPAFEALRVRASWAGYYEMNAFDHNGIAGALPGWRNAYTACGFSGHGMQQAPAVGAALAALVAGEAGRGTAVPDLAPLSPRRLLDGRRLIERNII